MVARGSSGLQLRVESLLFGAIMTVRPAISRKTLYDELVAGLRNMIVDGELAPGSRIREARLCDHFGVSRTPLREALKVLSVEGLVVLLPNRGARVAARVTRKEMEEIVSVLGALMALAGELACASIRADEIARIRSLHAQMIDHLRAGDPQSYAALKHDIDNAIFEAAGNQSLSTTYDNLRTRLRSLRGATPPVPPDWADAVREYEEMVTALASGDGAGFASVARRHIRHTQQIMRIALDTLDAQLVAKRLHKGEAVT
jgi:DNA-binding GntR family transcriptional regulator